MASDAEKPRDDFLTFTVKEAGLAPTHFKLRRTQRLGVMFREFTRRRELALGRPLAYDFALDGDAVDAEHTARLLVLEDDDVIVAVERAGDDVAPAPAPAPAKKPSKKNWWKSLPASETDPISLEPLRVKFAARSSRSARPPAKSAHHS
mmetsp:Transcript_18214/g.56892  ORF Transcript_18214/g.56892 Transcript_18214/m.56892 type:complete len:149 (-) Transcript_18214:8-454(-)